ncbi:MAG TPA: TPM domain-containing protein [Frankiaceae bacterium]|nr:TPM domain-containing protein [Frankiaceae bacterium]
MAAVAALVAFGVGGPGGGVAAADHTPRLTSQVVDETGSVGRGARAAVDELLRERDVQLYAVFVSSVGASSGPDYAAAVARENGLGGNDAVLVVSPTERRYGMWVSSGLRGVTRTEVDSVLSRRVEPELRAGDWDGAVSAAADGLGDAVSGDATRSGGTGTGSARVLLLLLLVGGGAFVGWRAWQRRRAERAVAAERAREHEQVGGEAAAALIRVDERLRDADADVRLVGLTSDDPDAAALYERLAGAREHVRVAFELRAREEDAPDVEALRRVLAECAAADELLDAVTARTAELRDVQQHAPETLRGFGARLDAIVASAGAAEASLGALRERVPETARTVEGNLPEARKRVEYARAEVARGLDALPDVPRAARHARLAEQSAARAEQLVEAVAHLEQAVAEATAALPEALRTAERAVAAARAAGGVAGADDRVARAEAALGQARAERDVVVAVRLAGEAAAYAEPVVGAAASRREALDATLAAARTAYTTAYDFVAARREGVGERPRAKLMQAERELENAEALRGSDPDGALDAARQAEALAWEAYELAADDFDRLDRYDRPYGGGFFGGFGMPLPLPIPIIIGGGGGWGGHWGGGWDGGWDGGGLGGGGDFGGGGDSFGGTF